MSLWIKQTHLGDKMDILEKIENILNEGKMDEKSTLDASKLLGIVHRFSDDPKSNSLADRDWSDVESFVKAAMDFIEPKDEKKFKKAIKDATK